MNRTELALHSADKSEVPVQGVLERAHCGQVAKALTDLASLKVGEQTANLLAALERRGLVESRNNAHFCLESKDASRRTEAQKQISALTAQSEANNKIIDRIEGKGIWQWCCDLINGQGKIDAVQVIKSRQQISRAAFSQEELQVTIDEIDSKENALRDEQATFAKDPNSAKSWRITPRGKNLAAFITAHGKEIESLSFDKFDQGLVKLEQAANEKLNEIEVGLQKLLSAHFPSEIALEQAFAWSLKHKNTEGLLERALELAEKITQSTLPPDDFRIFFNVLMNSVEEPGALVEKTVAHYEKHISTPLALFLLRSPEADPAAALKQAETTSAKIAAEAYLDDGLQRGLTFQLLGVSDSQCAKVSKALRSLQHEGLLATRELVSTALMISASGKGSGLSEKTFLRCYREAAQIFGDSSDLYVPCAILATGKCISKSHLLIYQELSGRLIELGYGKDALVKGAKLTLGVLGSLADVVVPELAAPANKDDFEASDGGVLGSIEHGSAADFQDFSSDSSDIGYFALLGAMASDLFDSNESHGAEIGYSDNHDAGADFDHDSGSSVDFDVGSDGGSEVSIDSFTDESGGSSVDFDGGFDSGGSDVSFDGGGYDSGGSDFGGGGDSGGGDFGGSGGDF